MQPQKKMVYMQRIFNPNQYRSSTGLASMNKENFARTMNESINKAINSNESPVKEKHVRKLVIGSFQAESGTFFWQYLPIIRLKENQVVCWKFCHVLHKMLRDGHRQVLTSSYERRQILLDCGNMWRHVEDGYGQLIFKYCTLLYNRINFLMRNPRFPNDLKVTNEQLDEIGEHDPSVFFDLSCEIFDSLDDILRLQELVLVTLDLRKYSSTTSSGQCHLAPLVACIQDSSLLYDYSVKILFKLHNSLPASTLEGHRDRFLCQHQSLKNFYLSTSNLQYFRTLIQIPHLSDKAPNFLIASDLQQHVTPKVVMILPSGQDSPDQSSSISQMNSMGQLLVDFNEDLQQDDLESSVSQSVSYSDVHTTNDDSIDTMMNLSSSEVQSQEQHDELLNKVHELEDIIIKLRQELETTIKDGDVIRENLIKQLDEAKKENENLTRSNIAGIKKLKDEVANLKCQVQNAKSVLEKTQDECKRAHHDNDISQGAMKKLVKDLSDLKIENENLRKQQQPNQSSNDNKAKFEKIDELEKLIADLKTQLEERNNQCQKWVKEKELLVTANSNLEKKLGTQQEDLLMAEMNETDKIIKEATRKIEELSEKSRKIETGIKLQVNEKISEVCSNLMKAVRSLIIQSRLLQREVVGAVETTKVEEFYKRNSSWTEGLISAANVVAMAARSLVDSADRSMSGQSRFSELAAAAHEIAAATAQLVVASRVKANKDSERLKNLTSVAKQVNQCTGNVVDAARICGELIEQEVDKIDISSLSLHQTKKLEMETQVKLLELEDQLSKERIKLGLLRRQHYEQEDAQINNDKTNKGL